MKIKEIKIENIVVGTGAAGFQAALRLYQDGEEAALVTDNIMAGTSRNTGSDKQTYYKLSLAGEDSDSVLAMAEDLFRGQCVDGDQALCEAALSVRSFLDLVELGVPFPCTEYGEFMGYKTDHDRGRRATSAGPYTSKFMTECLEKRTKESGIRIMDKLQVIRLLVWNGTIYGVLCLDKKNKQEAEYVLIWTKHVILATGGPAGMYRDSVYPASHLGMSGMAFEAGVKGKNLTEWQFGLASLRPRWNVSGTYMQVLPRFISTDQAGKDEREFLADFFENQAEMLSMIFLKGYQWPFDVNKIFGGSSLIDLLVYRETILLGRRVYLDFTQNPGGGKFSFEGLLPEAYEYLQKAEALFGAPIERLEQMNRPAIDFYKDHQVDLYQDKLEIAICVQHNNGGLATDAYWQTNISGLFAVGEVCGSHGVARPGGSALNAGQVGAIRAAEKIRLERRQEKKEGENLSDVRAMLRTEAENFIRLPEEANGSVPLNEAWKKAAERMSACGGIIREAQKLKAALREAETELRGYTRLIRKPEAAQLPLFYRFRDMLTAQNLYLFAMLDYCGKGGGSRGSALYTDEKGKIPRPDLPELYRCCLDEGRNGAVVQEVFWRETEKKAEWRSVRPIPQIDYFFENQWKKYREREKLAKPVKFNI